MKMELLIFDESRVHVSAFELVNCGGRYRPVFHKKAVLKFLRTTVLMEADKEVLFCTWGSGNRTQNEIRSHIFILDGLT